jgi:Chaperone of endosialidase
VYGTSTLGRGVIGVNTGGTGSEAGVLGTSACTGATCGGVVGTNTGGGNGVAGTMTGNGSGGSGVFGAASCTNNGCNGVSGEITGDYTSTTWVAAAVSGWDNTSGSGNHWAGYFTGNVYATGSFSSSDIRLKKNVQPLEGALDQLLRLKGVTFEWINPDVAGRKAGTQRGFIAQDVEKVFPEWIGSDKDGYKSVSVNQIEALEVESIRQLNDRANKAEARADKLQAQLDKQQAEIDTILHGKDPISQGPGFGSGMLALFAAGFAGATGLMLKRMGLSIATVVGLLVAGRKKDEETKS